MAQRGGTRSLIVCAICGERRIEVLVDNFHNAERRQEEAIARAEKLLEKIRRY